MSKTAQQSGPHTMKGASTPRSVRLTENQQMVLIRASQRDDAELVEPNTGSVVGASGNKDTFGSSGNDRRMIQGFLKKGLIEGDPDEPSALRLTALAFVALNIDISEWPKRLQTEECNATQTSGVTTKDDPRQQVPRQPFRPGTKGAKVLALLKRKSGATLDQMETATGWQTHSIRGFLSGTVRKKLCLDLSSSKTSTGTRVYRVGGGA